MPSPQILVGSTSITPDWCNVTLECRASGATDDLNVTWENKGIPGEWENPDFKAAIARILKACKAAGKYAMVFTPTTENVKDYYEQGFDIICYSLDAAVLISAYRRILEEIK